MNEAKTKRTLALGALAKVDAEIAKAQAKVTGLMLQMSALRAERDEGTADPTALVAKLYDVTGELDVAEAALDEVKRMRTPFEAQIAAADRVIASAARAEAAKKAAKLEAEDRALFAKWAAKHAECLRTRDQAQLPISGSYAGFGPTGLTQILGAHGLTTSFGLKGY